MQKKMKVVFVGRGELGLQILKRIVADGYEVPLILVTEHTPEIGSCPAEFETLAEKHGIPYGFTKTLSPRWIRKLNSLAADIAVAIQWRTIINADAISTCRHGFLNVHCGDLPRFRGNATPNWAILLNELEAVLCVHFMIPGDLDSGEILGKSRIPLTTKSTIGEICEFTYREGPLLVASALKEIETGIAITERQNAEEALRCYPRLPQDGEINWNESAQQISSLVRSLSDPFDGAYTFFGDQQMRIWACREVEPSCNFVGVPGHVVALDADGTIRVITGDNGMLELSEVQFEDGKRIPPGNRIRSIRVRLGMHVSTEIRTLRQKLDKMQRDLDSMKERVTKGSEAEVQRTP